MSRQRFLHHYLPAHLASALVAGAVLNFILVEAVDHPVSAMGPRARLRPAVRANLGKVGWGVVLGGIGIVLGMFIWLAPLTYGIT
jgi:dolichyl-phosphate-mannose-protein mannosyltransferase